MISKDLSQWTEQEIINFFLSTNDARGMVIPAVMKGLASVVLGTPIVVADFFSEPSINIGLKIAALLLEGSFTYLACVNVFNEQPKNVLNDHKFLKTLQNYYGNLKAGDDVARLNKSKEGAIGYYKEAFDSANILSRDYNKVFEKHPWLCELFLADALSYLGSINTSIGNFSEGTENFKNALGFINNTKQYNAIPIDRAIEIEGFSLSNNLRNVASIASFIQNNEMKAHDERIKQHLLEAEKTQNEFAYSHKAKQGIIGFLKEHYTPKKKAKDAEFYIAANLSALLERNNDMKRYRALGKYYAIRACYDFIQLGYKIGSDDTNIRETEEKINKGLLFLARSYCNDSNMTVEKYLDTSAFHSELQIALARNFTILYGLGRHTGSIKLMENQLKNLFRSYTKNKDETDIKKFANSMHVAIEHVLKPFGVPVEDTDDLIEKFIFIGEVLL
jgi:hypothetical protein